ncbi:CARDB domain-containing protein [Hyalangium versicolor]|uniref:CARDB domain-containing protein n=1 Tax=Hyalangium versicolor TaxID=2861190 RepID=UPI001CCE205C|nr:CARDB domain-containing protein [Hyalangium versicolor]
MPSRQEGWKWIHPVMLAWVLIITLLPGASRASADIVVMENDGSSYDHPEESSDAFLARGRVAQRFYATHTDSYDFLVVLPTFDTILGKDADGLHVGISNQVSGIGKPLFDNSPGFGNAHRLKGYIDLGGLRPGSPSSLQWEAVVLAHEVAHQWSGQTRFRETSSAPLSQELLGKDGAHWSFFLDSDASVLHGSDWEPRGPQSFESVARQGRYSALDLYLMGFLNSQEVAPMSLLTPTEDEPLNDPTAIPPVNGTTISATSREVSLSQIIQAEGPRTPNSSNSQKHFRAAFILLTPKGQTATAAQIAYADSLRHAFENHFFFLTRGRGAFETDLVEQAPGTVTSTPGVELGLSYLLSRQSQAGSWGTTQEAALRETQQAMEVLRLFLSSEGVSTSLTKAKSYLQGRHPTDVDGLARLSLATQDLSDGAQGRLRALLQPAGGVGLSPGYRSTLLDTALLGLALTLSPSAPDATPAVTEFLLNSQNADGGWAALPGGPSRFEPTALVLDYFSRVPKTASISAAANKALQFFHSRYTAQGFLDEGPRAAATGWAVMALSQWQKLTPSEAAGATQTLWKRQRQDGSWEASVVDTALALRALRILLTPNLVVKSADISLSASSVMEGESVLATVSITNTGYSKAENVLLKAFDSNGNLLGVAARLTSIEPGERISTQVVLDTHNAAGSIQAFFVVDPGGEIDEGQESDNRAAVPFFVSPAPTVPDLFVQAGSVTVNPASINHLPVQVEVSARVGNLGKVAVGQPVNVVVRMGTQALATSQVTLGAQSSQPMTWQIQLTALQAGGVITVEVDPSDAVPEPVETNNQQTVKLGLTPGVDLRVTSLTAPATVDQGHDIAFQYALANGGTLEAQSTGTLEILSNSGATIATLPLPSQLISAGGQATGQLVWRANTAGSLKAVLKVQYPGDLDSSNNTGSALFTVQASSLPNLLAVGNSLTLTPEHPLETQPATVRVTVRNSGQSAARDFTVDLYLGVPESGGTRFHREQVSTLAAGATLAVTGTLTLPQDAPKALYVVVDGTEAVSEFDEDDNRTFLTFSSLPIADLVASSAGIRPDPAFPRENTTVPVTVVVLNAGGQRAENIPVELLRVTSSGSEESIGQTSISAIEAGQSGEAIISWNTTGLRGPQKLVAFINKGQSVPEQRTDNNRAERQVSVQDAALALSEPYFSPNGDGIRETTEITYRLATEAPVEARIEDAQGRTVRVLTAATALASSLSWDGRSTEGRIVPDGTYSIHVRTQAAASATLLGTLTAVVDTNRTLLDSSEPSSIEVESLQGTANAQTRNGPAAAMPDESGVVFYRQDSEGCGIYAQSLDGAPARRLTPDGWSCSAYASWSQGLAVSPDARWVAFHGLKECPEFNRCSTLELLSIANRSLIQIANNGDAQGRFLQDQVSPAFSRDGSRIFFVTREQATRDFTLEEARVDGTQRRILARSTPAPVELSVSPAGDRLAVVNQSGALYFIHLPEGTREDFLPTGTLSGFTSDGNIPVEVNSEMNRRHDWEASGEMISYAAPGLLESGEDLYDLVPIAPKLEQKELKTGRIQQLFAGAFHSRDFLPEAAALAVNPISGGTAFRHWPLLSTHAQIWTVSASGTARMLLPYDVGALRWSPGGSFLFGFVNTGDGGGEPLGAVVTRDNLFVKLTATRTSSSAAMTFQGTAADLNFEEWQLGVRTYGSTGSFVTIAASATPVRNGLLTEWVPPAPGMYEARLLAKDRAGNVRTRTVAFGYSLSPAVANVTRAPEYFSPNGDGVLDSTELHYSITRATIADFQVLDSHNQVVQQSFLNHPQAGDFTLSWNGRDANGQLVPDGTYTLMLDGTRLSVVVDNTPPVAQLALAALPEAAGSRLPEPYLYMDVLPQDVVANAAADDSLRTTEPVRIVGAGTSWKVQDANLKEWTLEVSPSDDPSVSRPLLTGTQPVDKTQPFPIAQVRGPFRLRAKDLAGNQALTVPVQLNPPQLFVTLGGSAQQLSQYWLLPGQVMPRVLPFTNATMAVDGTTVLPRVEGGKYAFGLNTSDGSPLTSFSVAYHLPSGAWVMDSQNVSALGENMVIWDSNSSGGVSEFEIRALDTQGNTLKAAVRLTNGSEGGQYARTACVKTRGGETTVISSIVGNALTMPEDLAAGSKWRFTSVATQTVTEFPVHAELLHTSQGLRIKESLPTSSLPECQYSVQFLGTHVSGTPLVDLLSVDLCKPQVTLSQNGMSVSESFRQGLRSIEVFVEDHARQIVVARFDAFEGTSPIHPIDRSLFPDATGFVLRARATLTDGTRVLTRPNLNPADPKLLDPGCNDEAGLEFPQAKVELSSLSRDADAPLCSIHEPLYTSRIKGNGGTGQQLQALDVRIVTAQGEPVAQPQVSGVVLGSSVVDAVVRIDSKTLQKGNYLLRASATWSDGAVSNAVEQPVYIDKTPAQALITSPAAVGRVCPESRRGSNGAIEQILTVQGAVSDDHLESYELFVGSPDGEPQRGSKVEFNTSVPSSFQGVLGTIDLSQRSHQLELLLSARDVSGSSWCATPVVVEVAQPPSIGSLLVSPTLFSPDTDGALDATTIGFTVDQAVSYAVSVETGTQSHTILQGQTPQGSASLSWNGPLENGSHLPDGDYTLRLRVTSACGMTDEAATLVRLDTSAPVARIDFPAENQVLGGSFTVTGAATDVNLSRYELSLGEGASPTSFAPIASAQTAASGVLGEVALASLPMGQYTLRLVVEDKAGHSTQVLRHFQHQPAALLRAASVMPTILSPDGDGISDTGSLNVMLAAPATVSAVLLDPAGHPLRTLVQPTALPASTSQLPLTVAALQGLLDGVYSVRVTADSGSNTEDSLASFEIDISKPHVVFSSPVAGSVRGAELTVEGIIDDPHLESWTLTHQAPGESTGHTIASGIATSSGLLAVQSGLTEGTHQLTLKASDRAGHSQEQSVSFTVDTTSPVVSFLSPANGSNLSGSVAPLEIRGQAEDAHLRSVSLEAHTVNGTQTLFSGSSLPPDGLLSHWAVGYDADGPAELHLKAEDSAGNTAESLLSFVLDSTPPVATLSEPHGSTRGEGLVFRGSATDANLSRWELELGRGTSASETSFQMIASASQPLDSGTFATLAFVGDGSYIARLRVIDSAGNVSVDDESFTIDSIAPLPSPALSATVQRPNTVTLTWEPSPSSDVTAYEVRRASGSGSAVVIATVGADIRAYVDGGLLDGRFRYSVVARDAAHNASNSSPEAQVEIDSTPPMVSWLAPTAGEQVRGTYELQGTAYSPSDFREYRVSIGAGNAPTAFTLLTRSLLPVSAGRLGELAATGLPQGSIQTLRLEAEDLIGNVSETRVAFLIDNLPPVTPTLAPLTVAGSTVTLSWQTTAEDDLLGFVIFRDGAPLGTPSNSSPQDLRPYALPADSRSFQDLKVPDGSHTYSLVAIDRAGNVSPSSSRGPVVIETRAPVARIVEPSQRERLRQDTWLVAQSEDQDIASITFESRASPTGTFTALGAPATQMPFTRLLPLSQVSGRVVELRAVAKDGSNKTDAAPASIHVLKEAIPSKPSATALIDGDQVEISWTNTNPAGQLTGFELSEDGVIVTQAPERWPGTAAASSGTPANAYDDAGTLTSWTPQGALPQAWTLTLTQPVLLHGVTLVTKGTSTVRLEAQIAGFWVPLASDVLAIASSNTTHTLDRAVEAQAIRVTFLSLSSGTTALSDVQLDAVPLEHGSSTVLSAVFPGQHTYRLRAMGFGGTPSEAEELSVNIYAPQLEAEVAETPGTSVKLLGHDVPPSARVEVFNENGVAGTTTANAQGGFELTVPLVPGDNTFQAQATDAAGNRSLPSEPVTVVSDPAPTAGLTLALTGVTASDVSLSLSVAGDASNVAGYALVREGNEGTVELPPSSAAARSFIDRGVRNGTYTYRVHAFNARGFRGPASNGATATVAAAPPASPVDVAVEPLPSGGALSVTWSPGDARTVAYRVERAIGATGAFEALAGSEHVLTTEIIDRPLNDSALYRYRILALDALGNLSSPSLIVSGVPVDSTPPAPPHLMHPTVAGKPVTVSSPTVAISGLTEAGTHVTLLRNGVPTAEAIAGALSVEAVPLELSLTPASTGWASADGERLAYAVADGMTAPPRLAVQSRTGELLGTFGSPSFSSIQRATFSPDGKSVAVEAFSSSTYRSEIHIVNIATGEVHKAGSASLGDETSATWSANSRELAYEVALSSASSSIVVVDTVAGTQRSLTGEAGAPLMAPRYAPGGSTLFALTRSGDTQRLLRMDPVSGASTSLFEAESIERDYAVSADSARIALVATLNGMKDLHTVSVSTGASVLLTHGQEVEKNPAFSRDGHQLAFSSGNFLVLQEDGRQQRFSGSTGLWLSWTQEGTLLTSVGMGLSRLEWGARFEFTGVSLQPGTTVFSATATDAAQRTSLAAAPIQITLDASTLPDLVAEVELRPEVPQVGHPFDAFVTVRNQGGGAAPATTVSVAVFSPDGQSLTPQPISVPALASGGMATALVPFSHPTLQGPQILEVIVDPEQQVKDPVRDNNRVRYPFSLVSDEQLMVALSVSPQTVDVNGNSMATITVSNPGSEKTLDVETRLVTADGELVFQLGETEHLAPLGAGRSRTFTRPLAAGQTLAGSYQVKTVVRQGTAVLVETAAPFTINADRAALLRIFASRSSYGPGEAIALTASVRNDSRNSFLDGASYILTVTNGAGTTVQGQTTALPLLTQGASYSVNTELSAAGLPPGQYEAHGVVMLGAQQLATASTHFSIVGRSQIVGTVSVLGQGTPPAVRAGEPLTVAFEAGNTGTAAEQCLVLRVAFIDALTNQTLDSYALPAQPLEVGGTLSGMHGFSTSGLPLRSYAVYLIAEWPNGTFQTLSSASFRLADGQAPTLRVINLLNGKFLPGGVNPVVQATDPESGVVTVYAKVPGAQRRDLALVSGNTFDGNWSGDAGVWEGTNHPTFFAVDAEGNIRSLSTTIIVDPTPPQIKVTGVTEGYVYRRAPSPVVQATDEYLASAVSYLDNQPFTSGTPVTEDGTHDLLVQATDLAGNQTSQTLRFTVDTTPPAISISGVTEGGVFRQSVVPVVTIRDRDLLESSIRLDNARFIPGTVVTAEGKHILRASATDRAGNETERQLTFTLDQTPPAITITGVSEGALYSNAVTPVIDIQDAHPGTQEIRLNGVRYTSGTSIDTDGSYTLTIHVEDLAGWVTERTVRFSVQTQWVNVSPNTAVSFARVLALIRAGTCTPTAAEVQRVQGLLEAELGGKDRLLTVTTDEAAFLESLRAGVANVVIVFSLGSTGSECSETVAPLELDPTDTEAMKVRKAWSIELTEQVFAGHAGLVVIRSRTEDMPLLREVLGVDFRGPTQQGQVQLPSSALHGPAYLSAPGGGAILQALKASVQPVATWSGNSDKLSGALTTFGQGRSVTFGVDLSSALPTTNAAFTLSSSVAYVLPPPSEPSPLGVQGVELRLSSPFRATQLRSVETLSTELTALWTSSQGTLVPGGRGIVWEDSLEKGATRGWRFLVRLPESSGSYSVSASVSALQGAATRDMGTWKLDLEQPLPPSELVARVRLALKPLLEQNPAAVSKIEARLQSVEAREVTQRSDIEAQFEELFRAIETTQQMSGESAQVRKALGDLLHYWEARWYLQ